MEMKPRTLTHMFSFHQFQNVLLSLYILFIGSKYLFKTKKDLVKFLVLIHYFIQPYSARLYPRLEEVERKRKKRTNRGLNQRSIGGQPHNRWKGPLASGRSPKFQCWNNFVVVCPSPPHPTPVSRRFLLNCASSPTTTTTTIQS